MSQPILITLQHSEHSIEPIKAKKAQQEGEPT